jgi:uncharacterized protein
VPSPDIDERAGGERRAGSPPGGRTADQGRTDARLERLLRDRKTIRAIGFDDAPFTRASRRVPLAGVVCAGTRFEGLVWGRITRDGADANAEIERLLHGKKFLPQLHVVLLDGIAFGGFNVVDLPALAESLRIPCVAVMRRAPDLAAIERVLRRLPRAKKRLAMLGRAGEIHEHAPFVFQVAGASASVMQRVLSQVTDRGHVPEALRLAHLIGSAVMTGESGRRA